MNNTEPLPLYMDEDDIVDIHNKIVSAMRACGLSGHALDEATSECFRAVATIVMRERDTEAQRRAAIRVVE